MLSAGESLEEMTALTADQFIHILHFYLSTTYCVYQRDYYQQKEGITIGSQVFCSCRRLYGNVWAFNTKNQTGSQDRERHVLATFCAIEEMNARTLLNHLDNLCPTIQFTMELEKDRTFLSWTHFQRDWGRKYRCWSVPQDHWDRPVPTVHFSPFSMSQRECGLMSV